VVLFAVVVVAVDAFVVVMVVVAVAAVVAARIVGLGGFVAVVAIRYIAIDDVIIFVIAFVL
jgi:hypothetical protein